MNVIEVPCNGCTLCCHRDAVRILPHEDAKRWRTEPHPYFRGQRMLAHNEDDDCVYLGPGGCTIYEDRPQMCGELDCRIFSQMSYTKARKLDKQNKLRIAVWRCGKQLARETGWTPGRITADPQRLDKPRQSPLPP